MTRKIETVRFRKNRNRGIVKNSLTATPEEQFKYAAMFWARRLRKLFEAAALRGSAHVDALASLVMATARDIDTQMQERTKNATEGNSTGSGPSRDP